MYEISESITVWIQALSRVPKHEIAYSNGNLHPYLSTYLIVVGPKLFWTTFARTRTKKNINTFMFTYAYIYTAWIYFSKRCRFFMPRSRFRKSVVDNNKSTYVYVYVHNQACPYILLLSTLRITLTFSSSSLVVKKV